MKPAKNQENLMEHTFIKTHDYVDFAIDGFVSMNNGMIKSKFVRQCHYHVEVVLNHNFVRGKWNP